MNMRSILLTAGLILLVGCSTGPAPRIFVLSTPATLTEGVVPESGRPIVELKPVSLPDYLDTSDILIRNGLNELTVSRVIGAQPRARRWRVLRTPAVKRATETTGGCPARC